MSSSVSSGRLWSVPKMEPVSLDVAEMESVSLADSVRLSL